MAPPEDLLDDWGQLRVPVVFPPKGDSPLACGTSCGASGGGSCWAAVALESVDAPTRSCIVAPVGFVNSVVTDFQEILNPWPPVSRPQLRMAADKGERLERVRER